eukprot:5015095-Lingulodinium_polyedra.AAC.1
MVLADTGLWPFILLLVVVFNLEYGPWEGGQFQQRALEAMQTILVNEGVSHPFLRHFRDSIIRDNGWWAQRHDGDMDDRIQGRCLQVWEAKAQRVALNRWMNVLDSAQDFNKSWHIRLVAYLQVEVVEAGSHAGRASLKKAMAG